MTPRLPTAQSGRAVGALLAMAAGDALGAGYEFGPPLDDDVGVRMAGGARHSTEGSQYGLEFRWEHESGTLCV